MDSGITDEDRRHLARCVELAEEALADGDGPFGSVLVDGEGNALAEGRNREVSGGDATRHPEIELAQWAARNLTPEQRAAATLYTSGEHCAMCAAAHGWVGIGRLVFVMSTPQLVELRAELGLPAGPVAPLRAQEVAPQVTVLGPEPSLVEAVADLHRRSVGA
ncbi:nucleoside deaminase [Pseudactinotalea terrae]|uniref:nucleoside deaminase n=1 Tax=Pseudactinotalea terrae TaxID=1743262 RepID=UPI0018842218|nr:nucleoside deaminase [Pseudactinotalea terrae]